MNFFKKIVARPPPLGMSSCEVNYGPFSLTFYILNTNTDNMSAIKFPKLLHFRFSSSNSKSVDKNKMLELACHSPRMIARNFWTKHRSHVSVWRMFMFNNSHMKLTDLIVDLSNLFPLIFIQLYPFLIDARAEKKYKCMNNAMQWKAEHSTSHIRCFRNGISCDIVGLDLSMNLVSSYSVHNWAHSMSLMDDSRW